MATLLIACVRCYQWFGSMFLMPRCRFIPSCSQYMVESLRKKGAWLGLWTGFCRLIRCHPWGGHGVDPVP